MVVLSSWEARTVVPIMTYGNSCLPDHRHKAQNIPIHLREYNRELCWYTAENCEYHHYEILSYIPIIRSMVKFRGFRYSQ